MTNPRLCLTCGVKPVNRGGRRYCSHACVPSSVRANGAKQARVRRAFLARERRYADALDALTANGRRFSVPKLYEVLAQLERKAWQNGFRSSELKWQKALKLAS